ncbi:Serine/threonine-protein kinase Nek2 [Phytophthora cinnamomi]|uniref:Serine/threonine-protein kinase Nek2 n=1 Tax=Phytophthora cinnamomi TaxID=4785 RepID=UPI00355A2DED|nr:Serine/threonine-protein kinase Nek2 [Phytophthora cinnamomi]
MSEEGVPLELAEASRDTLTDASVEDEDTSVAARGPARRTSDPAPLRTSKRATSKPASGEAVVDARTGKKKVWKRATVASTAGTPRKPTGDSGRDSDSDLEDKPPAPPAKRPKRTVASAKTKQAKAVAVAKRPVATSRSGGGFDLHEFMASFSPGTTVEESAATKDPAAQACAITQGVVGQDDHAVPAQVQALQAEIERLLRRLPLPPNSKGEMPPAEVCYLTTASFPDGAKKAKGDYNPPQAHPLAASQLESTKFRTTPAILMAIFSGRLGSRGLTIMHFKESSEMTTLEDGSTNANFSSDFSPSASLPPTSIKCASYEDILDALHGLASLGQEVWYDHMRKLTSRLRNFVAKNKSADPENTPARVRLTLLYVNKFIGAALGFMQLDDPQWWSGFCEALRAIDYQSPVWTMALVSAMSQSKREDGQDPATKSRRDSGHRDPARRPAIPDAIRRLIPINRRGQEPCLLHVAGLPCSGGTRERCGNPRRVHDWPERLPARLQDWVERTYGSRSTQPEDRR